MEKDIEIPLPLDQHDLEAERASRAVWQRLRRSTFTPRAPTSQREPALLALAMVSLLALPSVFFGEMLLALLGVLFPLAALWISRRPDKRMQPPPLRLCSPCCFGALVVLLGGYAVARLVVLAGINGGSIYAGYVGKMYCSCYFISGRTLGSVTTYDVATYNRGFGWAMLWRSVEVDEEEETLTMRVLDITLKYTALVYTYYGPRFGCHLSRGFQSEALGPILAKSAFQIRDVPARSGAPRDTSPLPRNLTGDANGIPRADWDALLSAAFENPSESGNFAVMAWIDGEVVAEGYSSAAGVNASTPMQGWSMTKTVGALMLGLRVRDGEMSINDFAEPPELPENEVMARNLTLNSLMRMRVGKPLPEEGQNIGGNFANERMYFLSPDFAHFAQARSEELQTERTPSTPEFYYSSGSTNTYSRDMRRTFDDNEAYWSELWNEIFLPIGATGFAIETDATGTFGLAGMAWATAEDWLRLGILILNDGVWNGHRLLPAGWVNFIRQPFSWRDCDPGSLGNCGYRGGIWSNDPWNLYLLGHDGQVVEVNFGTRSVWSGYAWELRPTIPGMLLEMV